MVSLKKKLKKKYYPDISNVVSAGECTGSVPTPPQNEAEAEASRSACRKGNTRRKSMNIQPIGHIKCDFSEKFGIPRQSGLVETSARIIFEPKFRSPDAFRGLEGYSHIWLCGSLTGQKQEKEPSLTVRPPRLGEISEWAFLPLVRPLGPIP